jgi:hypothetical protein
LVEETTKPRENYRPAKSYKLYHIMSRENYRPAKSYKLYHIMLNTEPRENYQRTFYKHVNSLIEEKKQITAILLIDCQTQTNRWSFSLIFLI